jgi:predicted restriction endonuclease
MMLPDISTSRAVLIGTSKYNILPELPGVDGNLTALSAILQNDELWGLPKEHCTVVRNPERAEDILEPLKTAAAAATDTLLLYFAGHGIPDSSGRGLQLTLVNSDKETMWRSVPYDYLAEELRYSQARRKIVILDCCHAGRAFSSVMAGDDVGIFVANIVANHGVYLLSSVGEKALAAAPEGEKYTAFSGELIKLLETGNPAEGEFLSLDSVFKSLKAELLNRNPPMIPQRRVRDFGDELTFVRNRAHNISGSIVSGRPGYGRVRGIERDHLFLSRKELHDAGIHRPLQAGICGTAQRGGAESIVVSGGYKDDRDYGKLIIYTGHGGRDGNTGVQVADQSPTDNGNAALIMSFINGIPVRVVRGAGARSAHSPEFGYRYDGLFLVTGYSTKQGEDGYKILQFRLEQVEDETEEDLPLDRWERPLAGVHANRLLSAEVKAIYDFSCQICEEALEVPGGMKIAETVHIRDLGRPHNGPDVRENILCVCPNHRNLFLYGAIVITDEFEVIDQARGQNLGPLRLAHKVDVEHIRYHRAHHMLG